MQARFKHGRPLMIDYTPSGAAVSAGDVITSADHVRVAHDDIADGKLGAVSAGGGVYTCTKETGVAFADGDKLYWDATNSRLDKTNTNKPFGFARGAALSAATEAEAIHSPF